MVYLPTKLGSFGGKNVGKYTSPKKHLGMEILLKSAADSNRSEILHRQALPTQNAIGIKRGGYHA